MIPGLGDDAGRFQQNAELTERGIKLKGEFRFDAEEFGAEAVASLDAVFGKFAVAAHVPFTRRAGRTWDRIRMPDKSNDQISGNEAAGRRRLLHAPERLMPEDQTLLPGRRSPI